MFPYGFSDKQELLDRIGELRQIGGFQRMILAEGKGRGNEVIHVRNGTGLSFNISVSRSFDIGLCEFYGIPVSWLSASGSVAPYFYEKDAVEWNRNFEAGMLTTCGLTYVGKPNIDQGRPLGMHGKISSIPAELLQTEGCWIEDKYVMTFRAKMRETISHGKHLTLYRTITTCLGENKLNIHDTVINESSLPVEHMILYHFNFGFPLIGENASIDIPSGPKRWIDGEGHTDGWNRFVPPADHIIPTVLLHENVESRDGNVTITLKNKVMHNGKSKQLQVDLQYVKEQCPYLTQWKHPLKGVYVMGIEPGNASTEGRNIHRERGTLTFLEPGERREYQLNLAFHLEEE